MNLIQVGVNKKDKKPIYEELTYDFFAEHVDWEWFFTCGEIQINFAWHKENRKTIYEATITENGKTVTQFFESTKELLKKVRICGRSIHDIWDKLNGLN